MREEIYFLHAFLFVKLSIVHCPLSIVYCPLSINLNLRVFIFFRDTQIEQTQATLFAEPIDTIAADFGE